MLNYLAVLWSSFRAAPTTWMTVAYGLFGLIFMLSGKKLNTFMTFVVFGLSFAIGALMLSQAKQFGNSDLTFAGGGWVIISLIWFGAGINRYRRNKKAKQIATGQTHKP